MTLSMIRGGITMRKHVKKLIAFGVATVLALGSLSGCGSKKATLEESGSSEKPNVSEAGTLKLAVTTGDGSTTDDKIPTPWYNRIMATNLMFRGLFLADSSLTEVKPDLAESYTLSKDGLVYTITLKEGLKWSDGEDLTGEDVKFSIETAGKAATINSIYTAAFQTIKKIAVDGRTITLTLKKPYAAMLNVLAQFAILPKHSLEEADPLKLEADAFWKNPVTSGMYQMDELNVGNYFTLKVNENYEGAKPNISKIICYFVSDYVTAAKAGNTDYVFGNDANLVDSIQKMEQFHAHEVDVLFYKYFIFNMKGVDGKQNEAMQNVEVRKAIMEAIDRASLASLYPSASVLNSGIPNNNEAYNGFEYTYDTEKAKEAIQNSGYDMSRTLKICYYNNDQTSIDLINTVVYYLEQIGLKAEATLSNDGTTDLFTTRDYDIGFKGKSSFSVDEWYTEYRSNDGLFQNIFGGDTDFDPLIDELSSETDEAKRNEIYQQLQNLEQEKVYKVPLFTVGTYVFTSDHVILPEGIQFCNPLYMCDLSFEKWEVK